MLDAASRISGFGAVFWTLVLQYPLLKIYRARDYPTTKSSPTRSEACVGLIIVWAFQLTIDKLICHVIRNGVGGLFNIGILNGYSRYMAGDAILQHISVTSFAVHQGR
jgi:hypothetical protein